MRVLIIGASGTLGQAVSGELGVDCDLISANRHSGDFQVDLNESASIARLFQQVGVVDAVICTAARGVVFDSVACMTRQHYLDSMSSKLLGQVDLVTQGLQLLGENVSFTLTTGLLNQQPIAKGSAAAMVNAAIEGFVTAAAIDVPARQRVNVVSPALLEESVEHYGALFPGYRPVPATQVAQAYRKVVFGRMTGQVVAVGW